MNRKMTIAHQKKNLRLKVSYYETCSSKQVAHFGIRPRTASLLWGPHTESRFAQDRRNSIVTVKRREIGLHTGKAMCYETHFHSFLNFDVTRANIHIKHFGSESVFIINSQLRRFDSERIRIIRKLHNSIFNSNHQSKNVLRPNSSGTHLTVKAGVVL
jgi:hypothetical protein